MVAFTYRMPAGIPGDVNRANIATIVTEVITPSGTTGAPTEYGLPLVVDATSGQVRTLVAADTAVYGFLVRAYPTNSGLDPLGTGTPPASGPVDVMRRGFMTVKLNGAAAAAKDGTVYVWTAASGSGHVQGTVEAAASTGNTIAIPATFTGPADSNGNVEIAFNI